jgi:dethiobiotin synthase
LIPGVFVTGTGTDVGKTIVTAGLLRYLRSQGSVNPMISSPMVMKPVQTGCRLSSGGRLIAPDVEFVLRTAGLRAAEDMLPHLAPYRFQPACSPHLAARLAGRTIELAPILNAFRQLASRYRPLVVEGAGGLLVPLNDSQTMLDLACELRLPVLLVGHSGLGAINHTLLSLEALRRRACPLLGVLLNDVNPVADADAYIHDDNLRTIAAFGRIPAIARLPYLGEPPDLAALDAALGACDFLKEILR